MKIATLGPEGTYSHMAARKIGDDMEFYDDVYEIAAAIEDQDSDVKAGVLPIENSIEGSVTPTLDVLMEFDVYIRNEVVVEVHHALLSRSEGFDTVVSHPQALRQCRGYLDENYSDVRRKTTTSTAKAAETAEDDSNYAAIAHPSLAGTDLGVLEKEIQDEEHNHTRFVHVEADRGSLTGDKTTVIVYPGRDRPGLLYDILSVFKERGVNLSRIESRPSKHELGDYVFHIDFHDGDVEAILEELRNTVEWVEFKGSYGEIK
ncbi:MAG: prephenate dehydratase [Halobacteria archaeon]